MRLTVLGSTGRTGLQLLSAALDAGHEVVAAARDPGKLELEHPSLSTVRCDVLKPETLAGAVEGAEAVIVTIGGAGLSDGQTRSVGTRNVVAAMQQAGVERICVVSTAGVGDSIGQLDAAARVFVRTLIRAPVADHARQEAIVRDSGLRWTIARPGGLTDGPATGSYQADPEGRIRIRRICRADVAHFLIGALADPATEGRIYGLTS